MRKTLLLRRSRILHLILLAGLAVSLWASLPEPALAQSGNLVQNPNFETGNISPWTKGGDPNGIIAVEQGYNHTPSGTWNAVVFPVGQYVEMRQYLTVIPGKRYYLSAFVSTGGTTATMSWWTNVSSSTVCGSTNATWPTWVQISCEFVAPAGTTQFYIILGGSSNWIVSDDWHLAEAPAATTNYYIGTVDNSPLFELGRSAAYANQQGIIVLDFGDPAFQNGNYGTYLFSYGNPFGSTSQIASAVESFILGYYWFSPSGAYVKVAVSTNNHGSGANYWSHGQAWANMVNNIDGWIYWNGYSSKVSTAGASDMEPGWNNAATTRGWADGYSTANNREYYDFGSCDSCPSTPCPSCQIPNNWTREDIWYVSWGLPAAWPLPLIYAKSGINADQWYRMSLYSVTNHGTRMVFRGTGTQWQACQQKSPSLCASNGTDNTPALGWGQLAHWLNTDPNTSWTPAWSTDIRWQY